MDEESPATAPFLGSEHFLVGLSTSYWSNIPMSIFNIVHQMKIVSGVNCILQESQFFPVSKCIIAGMIVSAEANAKDKISYILDDGTGWVDCLAWQENPENIYSLPSIAGFHGATEKSKFCVGDRVRVFGNISCVNVSDTSQELDVNGTLLEVRNCIHEIRVTFMERLSSSETANDLDWEANHWIKAIRATKPATGGNNRGLKNANNTLEWLGPKIIKDVKNRENFPSASDSRGAWKVFGVACKCKLPYQHVLLYCHCTATTEALDSNFAFRDALLGYLLEMEKEHHKSQQQKKKPQLDFRFQYRAIVRHQELCKMAKQVVSSADKPGLDASILFQNTFRALRDDGVLCLLDEESDTYLLLSRKSVLEPYIRRRHRRRKNQQRRAPFYLDDVHKNRLQYLERLCFQSDD